MTRLRDAADTVVTGITLDALIERYDGILFDAYGVLVHGDGIMPGARETVEALRKAGRPFCLVTNDASTLPQTAAARYRRLGLPLRPEQIVSSGLLLKPCFRAHGLEGARCAVLGPADSERYVQLAGGRLVSVEADFDALVVHHTEDVNLVGEGVMNEGEYAARLGLLGSPKAAETVMPWFGANSGASPARTR